MTHSRNLRIVSLLPSATEIVAGLGLTDALVGRSHECDYPTTIKHLPICTEARLDTARSSEQIDTDVQTLLNSALSIYQIKTDVLKQLQPTHILTQDLCDVCAVSFADVEQAVARLTNSNPQIISLRPNKLADIWADIARVAQTFGVESKPLLDRLKYRLETCRRKVQSVPRKVPTVVAIEWTKPVMIAGNWIPELIEKGMNEGSTSHQDNDSDSSPLFRCGVMMGANVAREVAAGEPCESTLACDFGLPELNERTRQILALACR